MAIIETKIAVTGIGTAVGIGIGIERNGIRRKRKIDPIGVDPETRKLVVRIGRIGNDRVHQAPESVRCVVDIVQCPEKGSVPEDDQRRRKRLPARDEMTGYLMKSHCCATC